MLAFFFFAYSDRAFTEHCKELAQGVSLLLVGRAHPQIWNFS